MSDHSSTWPKIRISPAVKARIENLSARLKSRASLIELVDILLTQSIDLIESPDAHLTLLPQITAYRAQLGNKSLAEDSADYAARLETLEQMVRDIYIERDSTARVAEDSPTTRKRRKS